MAWDSVAQKIARQALAAVSSAVGNAPTSPQYMGVNLAGLEFGTGNIAGTNYLIPTPALLQQWHNRGANVVRIPFESSRLQRAAGADLNNEYASFIDALVNKAAELNVAIILDAHDYASGPDWASDFWGVGTYTSEQFADMWRKCAQRWGHNPNVIWGIQNEPALSAGAATVQTFCNAAVAAIRSVGCKQLVLFPALGANISTTVYAADRDNYIAAVVDPANNWALEVHQYTDTGGAGGNNSGTGAAVSSVSSLADVLMRATEWAEEKNFRLWLGEFGAGAGADAVACLDNGMALMQAHPRVWLGCTAWGAGVGWGDSYPLKLEPLADGLTRPQTAAIIRYWSKGDRRKTQRPILADSLATLNNGTFFADGTRVSLRNPGIRGNQFLATGGTKAMSLRFKGRLPTGATTTTNGRAGLVNGGMFLGIDANGKPKGGFGTGAAMMIATAAADLRDNNWHEWFVTAGPNGGSLWIDGVQVATTASAFNAATATAQFAINIGRKATDINEDGSFGSVGAFWPGEIAWADIWARTFPGNLPPQSQEGLLLHWPLINNSIQGYRDIATVLASQDRLLPVAMPT